jgi:predicted HicB family RNase H-like nuclease
MHENIGKTEASNDANTSTEEITQQQTTENVSTNDTNPSTETTQTHSDKDFKTTYTKLPLRLHKQLRFMAIDTGISVSEIVRSAVQAEVTRYKQKNEGSQIGNMK